MIQTATYALEVERINPYAKPANKHGNNGGTFQSGRFPTIWKAIKFLENVTKEDAIKIWGCYSGQEGTRVINWDNGEYLIENRSKY